MKKRFLSMLCAVAMLVTVLVVPVSAAAEASIGGVDYATLAEAIANADGETVVLLADAAPSAAIVVGADTDVTLDLNGKTLTLPKLENYAIVIKGKLTIEDNSVDKTGKVHVLGDYGIGTSTTCTGGLTINSGTFTGTEGISWLEETDYLIGAYGGTVTINGGSFASPYCIVNSFDGQTANVVVTGGSFDITGTDEYASPFFGINFEVSGGTYSKEIPEEYCADGFVVAANEDGTYGVVDVNAAQIGETKYATLADAIAAANDKDTVKLLKNISSSEIVVIDKAITLDGQGYTLTSTATRGINIDVNGYVEVKNLTLDETSAPSNSRGFNIINKPANVLLEGVTVDCGQSYAAYIPASGNGVTLTVKDSVLKGYSAITSWGEGVVINVENSSLTGVAYDKTYSYGVVVFEGGSGTLTVDESSSLTALANEGLGSDLEYVVMVYEGDKVTVDIKTTKITKANEDHPVVFYTVAAIGELRYSTLAAAIEKAEDGDEIKLLDNIVLDEIVVIDKAITLDGQGYTLTSTATRGINIDVDGEVTVKNLTLDSTSAPATSRGFNIINKPANVLLDNVKVIGGKNYAVYIPGSGNDVELTVKDSNLSGYSAITSWGDDVVINVENSDLKGVAYDKYYFYGVVVFESGSAKLTVDESSSLTASANEGLGSDLEYVLVVYAAAEYEFDIKTTNITKANENHTVLYVGKEDVKLTADKDKVEVLGGYDLAADDMAEMVVVLASYNGTALVDVAVVATTGNRIINVLETGLETAGADNMKVFVWNNTDEMIPLCGAQNVKL